LLLIIIYCNLVLLLLLIIIYCNLVLLLFIIIIYYYYLLLLLFIIIILIINGQLPLSTSIKNIEWIEVTSLYVCSILSFSFIFATLII